MSTSYVYGTGRRKEAVARVRLLPGDGSIVVNGKDAADYFRALLSAHPDARGALRSAGLLTRDPRAKERKKYGLKRARKAPQYTKR